jgi:hypothetical protein
MAATNVYLISETQLKEGSVIDENVDMKTLKPMILIAQDQRILPIIGTGLFNEIKTQIQANTLTALNTTLLDTYITPALKMWVIYEYTIPGTFKYRNKNVGNQGGENNTPSGIDELLRLMDYWKDKAEWYSERITKYLCENSSDYPLFDNPGDGADIIHPNGTNYTTNIYLGDDGCDCYDGATEIPIL